MLGKRVRGAAVRQRGARRGLLGGTCRVAMHCGTVPVFFTVKLRIYWQILIVDLKGVSCKGSHNFGWSKEGSSSIESSVALMCVLVIFSC